MERRIRGDNISVVVRARPLSRYEEARGLFECIEVDADGKRLEDPEPAIEGGDWEPLEELQAQNDIADAGLNMPVYQPPPAPGVMKLRLWLVGILSGLSVLLAGFLWWIYRPAPFSSGASEA